MTDIEYLALGGVEIGNNARAYSYAQCLSCCAGLLKCPGCEGIHDATSPWFPAEYGWTPVATNLVTNPSMESATGTTEVRRNYDLNPRMDNNNVGWQAIGGGVATAAVGGTVVDFATGSAINTPIFDQVAAITALPNELWIGSFEVSVPIGFPALTLRTTLVPYNGGSGLAATNGTNVVVSPGETRRITSAANFTTPANTNGVRSILYAGAAIPSGARFIVRQSITEKNGASGPYFDGGWPPRLGRNLTLNPAVGNALGWYSNNGAAYTHSTDSTFARRPGTNSKRADRQGVLSSRSLASVYSLGGLSYTTGNRIPVVAGATYTESVYVATDATDAPSAQISIAWFDSAGTLIGGSAVNSPVYDFPNTPRQSWFRVSYTVTAPANAVQAALGLGVLLPLGGLTVGGERTWFTDAQLEEGTVATEYSDGFSAPAGFTPGWEGTAHASASYYTDNDLTAAWTGTANNSASTLTGALVTNTLTANPERAKRIQSSQWASHGTKSVRIIPNQGASYAEFNVTLESGKTYTAIGTIRLPAVQTGTLHGQSRSIVVNSVNMTEVSRIQAPNEVGVTPVRTVFTTSAAGAFGIRLWNGAAQNGGDVWWDDFMVVEGDYGGAYFDGDFPDVFDADGAPLADYGWNGTPHASTSFFTQYTLLLPASSVEPEYNCDNLSRAPWYDSDLDASQRFIGSYLLGVSGLTDSTMTAPVVEGLDDGGVVGAQRYTTRAVRIRTLLIGCGQDAAEYGLAWLKAVLGDTYCGKHGEACGSSDLDFFIDCPPALAFDDTDYDAKVARYRRSLHAVVCTSGPVTQEEWLTDSGAYGIVVEFILTSESPFVWGETIPVVSAGSTLTAFDDVASNLMRYPSAEVASGTPVVVATNFAYNGSAEYGGASPTGWAVGTAPANAAQTAGQSADIAAVGPNSYRARLVASGAGTDQTFLLYYSVTLNGAGGNTPPLPAGAKPSVSMWGRIFKQVGAPNIDRFYAYVEWRDASTVLATTQLGDVPVDQYGGYNVIVTGLTVPAGSLTARLVLAAQVDYAAADELRMYGDAFALTVP